MKDRQEFTFEAAVRMRDRFLQQEVWERMGVPVKDAVRLVMVDEGRKEFQNILFSKIVPNCKKLGLLDRNNGWLRKRFTELGVIQFEDWVDTGEEYAMLDEVSKDREAAAAAPSGAAVPSTPYSVVGLAFGCALIIRVFRCSRHAAPTPDNVVRPIARCRCCDAGVRQPRGAGRGLRRDRPREQWRCCRCLE